VVILLVVVIVLVVVGSVIGVDEVIVLMPTPTQIGRVCDPLRPE